MIIIINSKYYYFPEEFDKKLRILDLSRLMLATFVVIVGVLLHIPSVIGHRLVKTRIGIDSNRCGETVCREAWRQRAEVAQRFN